MGWRRNPRWVVCITFHVCSSNAAQIVEQFAEIKLAEACCSKQDAVVVAVHIAVVFVVVKIVATVRR